MQNVIDLQSFFAALTVAGIPLLAVLIGSVQVLKGIMGTHGKATRVVSVVLGVVLGFGYWIFANGSPVGFPGWFTASIFGISLGIVAFGLYDAGDEVATRSKNKSK